MGNVPNLRFPGFTGEWKKCTIRDLCEEFKSGKNIKSENILDQGAYPVFGGNGLRGYADVYNHAGDYVLIGRQGALCGNVRFVIGKTYITEHAIAAKATNDNDTRFLESLFVRLNLGQFSDQSAQPGLAVNKLLKIEISVPSKAEQEKIASFLREIDERIVTQDKIIKDLKQLRSAMINRVFGEATGNVLKLGEIGKFVRGLVYSADDVSECKDGTIVVRANNLTYGEEVNENDDVVYVNKAPAKEQILQKGDMVICMANGSSNLVGKTSIYNGTNKNITVGAFCGIYRSDYPLIRWLMQTRLYRHHVHNALQGGNGAIANLNAEDILNSYFPRIPHEKEIFVYHCLLSMDHKIQAEQSLSQRYNLQKQYLLSQMFI